MTCITSQLKQLEAALASAKGMPSSDFDLNTGIEVTTRALTPAAVLIALVEKQGRLEVVLTRRSKHLKHHPGQIAFPGGKVDPDDPNDEAAALREANEEIGLDPSATRMLGALEPHRTVTNYSVRPYLALITQPFEPVLEPQEVDEVFTVPLSFLSDPRNFMVESRMWMGQARHYYVIPYGPYYIWGATARMLRALADRIEAVA